MSTDFTHALTVLGAGLVRDADGIRPLALALIGDALYALYVRQHMITRTQQPQRVHEAVTRIVCARGQARAVRGMWEELDEKEQEVVLRGRNAKGHAPPSSASVQEYRWSTGLECVFGYLYVQRRIDRLVVLMQRAMEATEEGADNDA